MKNFSKGLAIFFVMVLVITGTVYAVSAPTFTPSIASGSTVNPGDRVQIVIQAGDQYTALSECMYSWNGGTEKSVFDVSGKTSSKGKVYKFTFTAEAFPSTAGTYTIKLTATDAYNNTSTKSFKYIVKAATTPTPTATKTPTPTATATTAKDTSAPKITMSKASGSTVAGGTKLTMTVKDVESKITSLKYNWVGASEVNVIPGAKSSTNEITISNLTVGSAAGTYQLNVTAVNEAGLKTQQTFNYIVKAATTPTPAATKTPTPTATKTPTPTPTKDTTVPVITMSKASGSTVAGGTKLTMTVKDAESKITSLKYNWVGASEVNVIPENRAATNEIQVTNLTVGSAAGTYQLKVTVANADGLAITKTFSYIVEATPTPTATATKTPTPTPTKDATKPVITMSKASGSTVAGGTKLTMTVKDAESKITSLKYNWVGAAEQNVIPGARSATNEIQVTNLTVGSAAGTYQLNVTAVNEAGLKTQQTFSYIVKATPTPTPTATKTPTPTPTKDATKPVITMSKASGSVVAGGTKLTMTVKDAESKITSLKYNWYGAAEQNVIPGARSATNEIQVTNLTVGSAAGTYQLNVTAVNEVGLKTQQTFSYIVKATPTPTPTKVPTNKYPTVDADPDGGDVEYGDKIVLTADDKDGEIVYIEYYWDDEDDDTTKRYTDKCSVKVPSEEGKHYLYVRAMDDNNNLCDYERFTYYVEENDYPGNSDKDGELNTRIRTLRVEITNADDKIRFEPKEDILYNVNYYNGTSSKVKNAKIVVELPTNLKATKASDNGSISTKQITWNLGTLDAGEAGRVTFKANYTSSKVNEKIITVPAKIYSGSSLKDTSTVRNLIFCEDGDGTGYHQAYCVGYPDGTFLPEGRITRAELAAMICNIEGIRSTSRGQFTDANDHWAANYMQAVADMGYMKPRTYNFFGAEDYATRSDLAYAIAAILDVEDIETIYIQATDTKYCEERCALEQLLRLGIIEGYSDGTVRPNNNITRAEAVTIINNYLFRGELYTRSYNYSYNFEHNYANGGSNFVLRFTDLSINHWAYGQIMEATNNHRYERVMDGNEEML